MQRRIFEDLSTFFVKYQVDVYIPSASWFIQVNYQRCNKYNKCFFNDKSEDIYKRHLQRASTWMDVVNQVYGRLTLTDKTYVTTWHMRRQSMFFRIPFEFGFFDTSLIFHLSVDPVLILKFIKVKLLLIV